MPPIFKKVALELSYILTNVASPPHRKLVKTEMVELKPLNVGELT